MAPDTHEHHDEDRFSAQADTWDEKPGAVERATEIAVAVVARIPLSESDSVLEIGGGTGLLARALSDHIGTALVTDVAPGMVAAATRVLDDPQYSGWRAERFDVEHDPLPDERFDLILSQLALHHMGDVPAIIGRLFALLRPGGQVALADLELDTDGGFHKHIHDFHGHHGFSRTQLAGWLTDAGFVDVAVEVAGHHTKEVDGEERRFPILLATGRRPALLDGAQRVLLVHAHPDDETLATGALIADLVDRGVEVHVVTATRGERGELMDGVATVDPGSPDFVALRERELGAALQTLGASHHAYLGMPPARVPAAVASRRYEDSGMQWIRDGLAGPADDSGPESFTAATVSEAASDLFSYVEATEPDALVTYDAGGGYGHPDHVRTHEVTRAVSERSGIPMIEVIPPDREVSGDATLTEWSDLSAHLPRVQEALRSHATQVRVDGDEVVHVGGQREAIVTRIGLRLSPTGPRSDA